MFILHPGFLNRESGPDFLNAVVQFDGCAPESGDIEVDPLPGDWFRHQHQANPAYANVVLHVVWRMADPKRPPSRLPVLELAPVLDAPLAELAGWLLPDPCPERLPFVRGKCAPSMNQLPAEHFESLLEQAAVFRLEARAQQLSARAREAGWTQALWEGLFRALGYKHNVWPMVRLAELRPRWLRPGASYVEVLACLLGLSGLLPVDPGAPGTARSAYLRQLWDAWWRERGALLDCTLPARAWRLAGVRPANHPQRRLALAAHWITQGSLPGDLQRWCAGAAMDESLPRSLLDLLRPKPDRFWSRHYTLASRVSPRELPLLGADRASDLAVNTILPWLWAKARSGRRTAVRREVERRYLVWPRGPENAILKLARQRVLAGSRHHPLARRSLQQGLQQIVRDYCEGSNSLCEQCRFADIARHFGDP